VLECVIEQNGEGTRTLAGGEDGGSDYRPTAPPETQTGQSE